MGATSLVKKKKIIQNPSVSDDTKTKKLITICLHHQKSRHKKRTKIIAVQRDYKIVQ